MDGSIVRYPPQRKHFMGLSFPVWPGSLKAAGEASEVKGLTSLAPSCGFVHAAPGLMGRVSARIPSREGTNELFNP